MILAACALAGCRPSTVQLRPAFEVGDRLEFTSTVTEAVRTELGPTAEASRDESRIDTVQEVIGSGPTPRARVTVQRSGTTPRAFTSRLDRSGRVVALDLMTGLSARGLGIERAVEVPAGVLDPPSGDLRPGQVWTIGSTGAVARSGTRGEGRIVALSVEDGVELLETRIRLRMPVRGEVETPDGRVELDGIQVLDATTLYRLDDGLVWRELTEVRGAVEIVIHPPPGIDAVPVEGELAYTLTTQTDRVA